MIVTSSDLHRFRDAVAMVDGCFDPLHGGHIAYFKAASELDLPVLCNIAPDSYLRTKHPPLLPREERAAIIDALRYVTYTHIGQLTTTEVLAELRPRFYVKGEDWHSRLPTEQKTIARKHGIEIVFVATVYHSSTAILQRYLAQIDGNAAG